MEFAYIGSILLLIFGFGFVIFWHELGHFLAAKWAGVKVEQFAVGFGHAMFSWRKGLGLRQGSSAKEYENLVLSHLGKQDAAKSEVKDKLEYRADQFDRAAAELGISETEYRLNWIPLGGYVKMLGQDDMDPNSISDSPRAYNNKPISKRMVIVSAGVIMNIILAIVFFTILFRIGFNAPPSVVGIVYSGSPAQQAGIQVGDRILYLDGRYQHDFTKISMNVALVAEGQPIQILVEHPDKKQSWLTAVPRRSSSDSPFLQLGILSSSELRGPDPKLLSEAVKKELEDDAVRPGDTIVSVDGQSVGVKDYYVLDRAAQSGKPVPIQVQDAEGKIHDRIVQTFLAPPFGETPMNIAGMVPRTVVEVIEPGSSAHDKLKPGDIIEAMTIRPSNDTVTHVGRTTIMNKLANAGKLGLHVDLAVLRDGKKMIIADLDPSMRLGEGRKGLGVVLSLDESHPVVAEVLPDSAAVRASIPAGALITAIGGQPVENWRDVQRMLAATTADKSLTVAYITEDGQTGQSEMKLSQDQLEIVRQNHYTPKLALRELYEPRQTKNPLEAAGWGVAETRDLILQFYLTIRRMIDRSVSPSNMMGPIGIFHQGSKIAYRGIDWLLWFLAMISANLAVVNFLPIPIVDGGLFVFLILEKIMGKPLSPKAQSIAQIIGLALIASVFLFVTYHDIARLIL